MTEEQWVSCTDPTPMLEFLGDATWDRKRRLFTVACCRRIWYLIPQECDRRKQNLERYYKALEVAERYADGLETKGEVREYSLPGGSIACNAFALTCELEKNLILWDHPLFMVSTWASAAVAPNTETILIPWWVGRTETGPAGQAQLAEQAAHCHLLRDMFGNPFRPVAIDPVWLTPVVLALAQSAYDDRFLPSGHLNPSRLAELAAALEAAGCRDTELLGHLRGPGMHWRGCFALDLVLGKA